MRILLVQPDFRSRPIGFRLFATPEPLALEVLAGAVPDHEVAILDMRLEDGLTETLARFAPDVVAVTALTTEVYAARAVLQAVKDYAAEIFTVVGGHHATLVPDDFLLPYVDAVCLGEGEVAFPNLIEALAAGRSLQDIPNVVWRNGEGGFTNNGRTLARLDMDATPRLRRDLVEKHRAEYFFLFEKPDCAVATSRGCPHRCSFCSVWQFYGGRVCQMSVQRVVEEVRDVPTRGVTFLDDNFLFNPRRAAEIAHRIKAEGAHHRFGIECRTDTIVRHPEVIEQWAGLGLRYVLLGLEGPSNRLLEKINKQNTVQTNNAAIRILQANGVAIWGAFMVDVDSTADDFKTLRDYVTTMGITHTQFTILTPLPGTQLYRQRSAELLTRDYTCFDTLHAVLPTRLPREEFYRHFADLYRPRNLGAYLRLLDQGAMTVEDCRRGNEMLLTMSRWESYLENDPVLGRRDGAHAATTTPHAPPSRRARRRAGTRS